METLLLLFLLLVAAAVFLGLLKVLLIPLQILLKLIFLPIHILLNVLGSLFSSCAGLGCLTLLVVAGLGWLFLNAVF